MADFPSEAVIVRFGMTTPHWALSMSYGIFTCPTLRKTFHSPDQYLAYRMLVRNEDRSRVMKAPNGYIAYMNLLDIIEKARSFAGDPAIVPDWDDVRDDVMEECAALKYSQSAVLADLLLRTGSRPIYDDSRQDEYHWCCADGQGANAHGKILEKIRRRLHTGDLMPFVSHLAGVG